MKLAIACCLLVLSLLQPHPAAAADILGSIRAAGSVVIAHRDASLPFSYWDEDRHPVGYSIDLCLRLVDAIRRELDMPQLKLRYLPVDSVTRFTSIGEGKAHLECGVTTNNAERRQQVAFTIPHFYSGVRAMVRANDGIRNWPDLRGRTVVTKRNTTAIELLNHRNDVRSLAIKKVETASDEEAFAQLVAGKADVFPLDDVLLYGLRARSADPSRYEIIGDPLSVEPYAIMLPKGDPAFKKLIDREMVRLIESGEVARLYEKWFMRPIRYEGKTINMRMRMSYLLRDSLRFPSDKVGDR